MRGMLVDDAPGAEERAAVEIYGTLTLPGWWVVSPTVERAQSTLALLPADERVVLVVDRMVPARRDLEARDWVSTDDEPFSAFRKSLEETRGRSNWIVEFVTSHPSPRRRGGWHHWSDRCRSPLYALRPRLRSAGLLRYGLEGTPLHAAVSETARRLRAGVVTVWLAEGVDEWTRRLVGEWLTASGRLANLRVVTDIGAVRDAEIAVGEGREGEPVPRRPRIWIHSAGWRRDRSPPDEGTRHLEGPPLAFVHDLWEAWRPS